MTELTRACPNCGSTDLGIGWIHYYGGDEQDTVICHGCKWEFLPLGSRHSIHGDEPLPAMLDTIAAFNSTHHTGDDMSRQRTAEEWDALQWYLIDRMMRSLGEPGFAKWEALYFECERRMKTTEGAR